MALDFPANPTNGQTFGSYIYDSSIPGWRNVNSSEGIGLQFKSGLVPVTPTSVVVSSGSATVSGNGLISFTNASSVQLNGIFSAAYQNYRILFTQNSGGSSAMHYYRYTQNGNQVSGANYQYTHAYSQASSLGNTDNGSGATTGNLGYAGHMDLLVYRPFESTVAQKHISNFNVYGYTAIWGAATYATSGSFDGIIFSNTTYTGYAQVYGFN